MNKYGCRPFLGIGVLLLAVVMALSIGHAADENGASVSSSSSGNANSSATDSAPSETKNSKTDGAVAIAKPATSEKEEDPADNGLVAFAKILPQGKTNLDVLYPSIEGGVLQSVVAAKKITRAGDEILELSDMDLELYDEAGQEKEFTIRIKEGDFHIPTRQLTSDQETVIIGKTFTIRGDRSVFDTGTNQSQLTGNIRMVITDFKAFTGTESAPQKTPEATGEKPKEP